MYKFRLFPCSEERVGRQLDVPGDARHRGPDSESLAPRGVTSQFSQMRKPWEDIVSSGAFQQLRCELLQAAIQNDEFESVSMDATMRCTFPVMGQAYVRPLSYCQQHVSVNPLGWRGLSDDIGRAVATTPACALLV